MVDAHSFKVGSGYTVATLLLIAAIVLLTLIVHLIVIAMKNRKLHSSNYLANSKFICFLITTIIGLSSFEISLLMNIAVIMQIVMLAENYLNPEKYSFDRIYFESHTFMEYLIVFFDALGHLFMVTVFIARFEYCFKESIYGYSQKLIVSMYFALIILAIFAVLIFIFMLTQQEFIFIVSCKILWEFGIEFMCLWILYLFTLKLYNLLKMNLSKTNLLRDLTNSVIPLCEMGKRKECDKSDKSDNAKTATSTKSDGAYNMKHIGANNENIKEKHKRKRSLSRADTITADLLNVMIKMTLLVGVAVIASIFSIIANLFIHFHDYNSTYSQQETRHIWAYLLPIIDIMITSFMLYLQFSFTQKVYYKMCSKFDLFCLKCFVKYIKYSQNTANGTLQQQQHTASENAKQSELEQENKKNESDQITVHVSNLTVSNQT